MILVYGALLFFALIMVSFAFHELGHMFYLSLAKIKYRVRIKKGAYRIELIDTVTRKQYKLCLFWGIFSGFLAFIIVFTLYPTINIILYLGALTVYVIGSNNDIKKLKEMMNDETKRNV